MKILLSIKPEYAEKILCGTNKYEYRKAIPRNREIKTVVIYATMPVGKIVGEFDVADFISANPRKLWKRTSSSSGITRTFFDSYFSDRHTGHAIEVKEARRYSEPVSLVDVLGRGFAPQSFCYIA